MSTALERIWARIERRGPDECWVWSGSVGQKGQPQLQTNDKTLSPRRLLWEEANGEELPPTRLVSLSCETRRCLNPAHFVLRPFKDNDARFWSFVKKADGDACWEWHGYLFPKKGYGGIKMNGKMRQAHRLSWEMHFGPIEGHVPGDPDLEICVLHKCDNPRCVRPDHLFLGRDKDNHDDMVRKGRHSHGEKAREAKRRARETRARQGDPTTRRAPGQRGADTRKRVLATLPPLTSSNTSTPTNGETGT